MLQNQRDRDHERFLLKRSRSKEGRARVRSFCRTGPWRPRCCDVAQLVLPILEFNNGVNPCVHYAGAVQSVAAPRRASPPACWLSRGFPRRSMLIGTKHLEPSFEGDHHRRRGTRPEFRPGSSISGHFESALEIHANANLEDTL